MLSSSDRPLSQVHDLAMLDLDGVVYVGPDAVPGAPEAIAAARDDGLAVAYITNNASRPPSTVAQHLRELGIPGVADGDVVSSAQAVAHLVADAVPAGSTVLVVGGEGLESALAERGLRSVHRLADGDPVAVVQGFHPDLRWTDLAEGAYAVQSGLPWFASNLDLTIPTPRGTAPGNGSLVDLVANATGTRPVVAGKPEAPLFHETVERCGGEHPIVVGDRLDTDISGAATIGAASLAVLTGVSSVQDLADAEGDERPSYVAPDLGGLSAVHPAVEVGDGRAACGAAVATLGADGIDLADGGGSIERLRAVVGLAWATRDATGRPVAVGRSGRMEP